MMDNSNKIQCFRITQAYCSVCTWGFIQHFAVVRKLSFLLWITLLSCGLCVELGLETKVQGFGGMFLAKYECWAVAIRACRRNHTFSTQFHARTHTAPTVSKDRISPLTPIFLSFSNHSPSLSVFLSSILFVSPVSTIQDPPPSILFLLPQLHKYTYPLLNPQRSPQGAIVTQWEGSVTPALLLYATTPPSSSCFPSNHILFSWLIQYQHPLRLQVTSSCRPIGITRFYVTAGGVKLLSNNEGKKERL